MNIEIYTTTFCPYCRAAKRLLESRGLEYSEINIEKKGKSRAQLEELTGGRTVPQIVMDGESIGGYDDLIALDNKGKLAQGDMK